MSVNQVQEVGAGVVLNNMFTFASQGPKWIFLRFRTNNWEDSISSTKIESKTTVQLDTPIVDTQATILYPESPYLK